MFNDWIKIRYDLYGDTKVIRITQFLMNPEGMMAGQINCLTGEQMNVTPEVMRLVTLGGLVTVWGVARDQGVTESNGDVTLKGLKLHAIDDICHVSGFGEAMESVGWVKVLKGNAGLCLPKFFVDKNVERHKSKGAVKQQRYRDKRKAERDGHVTRNTALELERERERENNNRNVTINRNVVTPSEPAAAVVSQENVEEGPTLSQVVHELRGIGMDARVIPQLTASHPYPKIIETIEMVKARGNGVKNRAGLVRSALKGDWNTESATAGEDAYEEKRAAEHEAASRKREDQRAEHAKMHAEHLEHMNTLAALPPDEFEALKVAGYEKMPEGLRKSIPEDSDPLEHGVWRSFMWTEYEKRHTSPQGGDLLPGTV